MWLICMICNLLNFRSRFHEDGTKPELKTKTLLFNLLPAVFYITSSEVGTGASKTLVGPIRTLHKKDLFQHLFQACEGHAHRPMELRGSFGSF